MLRLWLLLLWLLLLRRLRPRPLWHSLDGRVEDVESARRAGLESI
jgi:hypothetical protein